MKREQRFATGFNAGELLYEKVEMSEDEHFEVQKTRRQHAVWWFFGIMGVLIFIYLFLKTIA